MGTNESRHIIFLIVAPFLISVGGFIGAFIFLQSPSIGEILAVFLAGIIGAIAGGFIGYLFCPDKSQSEGLDLNFLPFLYTILGVLIGMPAISCLTSYIVVTVY